MAGNLTLVPVRTTLAIWLGMTSRSNSLLDTAVPECKRRTD